MLALPFRLLGFNIELVRCGLSVSRGGFWRGSPLACAKVAFMPAISTACATATEHNITEAQQEQEARIGGESKGTEILIDKSKFDVPLDLWALRVPKQHSNTVAKLLSRYLFHRPRIKCIVLDPSNKNTRLIILSENIKDPGLSELPSDTLTSLRAITEVEVVQHQVILGYDYWPVEHILRDLLPPGYDIQTSFETIGGIRLWLIVICGIHPQRGHIAHLNIRDELIPYKKIIARVVLDKNLPKIRTVVNKVGTIQNEFRVPTFEVLAGDESFVTEVKEHGARFQLDYHLVYWNSRLEFEHRRLVSQFHPQQVVCDMFAGIGPFTIPAAQKGCIVYANDMNPDSVKYLKTNAKLNKVNEIIHIFNKDARKFMRELVAQTSETLSDNSIRNDVQRVSPSDGSREEKQQHEKKSQKYVSSVSSMSSVGEGRPWEHVDHIIMNLPASALEFLDVFQGLWLAETWKGTMPRVHCYCFIRVNVTENDVIEHAEKALNGQINQPDIWEVRDVAPNKRMLCLSFNLPEEVALKGMHSRSGENLASPSMEAVTLKKQCMDV